MSEQSEKEQYIEWNKLKTRLNARRRIPAVKEGEIWWAAVGKNIGIEINGKNKMFSRPVVIYKKFSRDGFLGISLTSQPHTGSWYVEFKFQGKITYAAVSQVKTMSVHRLYERIGSLEKIDLMRIEAGFANLYLKNFPLERS